LRRALNLGDGVNRNPNRMFVQHHVKYKEIDGEDEIVLMSQKAHQMLHAQARRDGEPKVPEWIVRKAGYRSPRKLARNKINHRTEKNKEYGQCLELRERLVINKNSGSVQWRSRFFLDKRWGGPLPVINSAPGE
jgi:hypothetical protein